MPARVPLPLLRGSIFLPLGFTSQKPLLEVGALCLSFRHQAWVLQAFLEEAVALIFLEALWLEYVPGIWETQVQFPPQPEQVWAGGSA